MRRLLGGLATLTAPVVAMAMFTGCQQQSSSNAQGANASQESPGKSAFASGEKAQLEDLAELCGLSCGNYASGEASVTGLASIDAFFGAVLSIEAKAGALEGEIKTRLGQMAAIVGAEVDADADIDAMADAVVTGYADFTADINGSVSLAYTPARCSVSADATLQAKAQCEAEVTPGRASVECRGECVADATVMGPECEGTVSCTGTAPSFECEGTCEGLCELEVAGECAGTCQGSCEINGDAACDGECMGEVDGDGNCDGQCEVRAGGKCAGDCEGSCELTAGATCSGECRGECTWDSGGASCNGEVTCTPPSGQASVMCNGECRGEVEPPEVEAECEASVKAQAELSAECTPPRIALDYELESDFSFQGETGVDARIAFQSQLEAFFNLYAQLLANGAELEGIARATGGLVTAAEDAISEAAGSLGGDADFAVQFKIASCLPGAIETASEKLESAGGKVSASVSAVATVSAGVGDDEDAN